MSKCFRLQNIAAAVVLTAALASCSETPDKDANNNLPQGSVSIKGVFSEKQIITAEHDLQDEDEIVGSVGYQWFRDGQAIPGATQKSFLLTYRDIGRQISVSASYTDGKRNIEAIASKKHNVSAVNNLMAITTNNDIYQNQSEDGGEHWKQGVRIAYDDSGAENISSASDGKGTIITVWYNQGHDDFGGDDDVFFSRSIDDGNSWSEPASINTLAKTDSADDEDPDIATDGKGRWIVTWSSKNDLNNTHGTDSDIFYSISVDQGTTWSAPKALNHFAKEDSRGDYEPKITTAGDGNWLAIWESRYDLNGTAGTDSDVFFSTSSDGGKTWEKAAPLNSDAATDEDLESYLDVTMNANGKAVAVWSTSLKSTFIGSGYRIVNAQSATSEDFGRTWSEPKDLPGDSPAKTEGRDWYAVVDMDNKGNVIAAWESAPRVGHGDQHIEYVTSSDNGKTWTKRARLANGGTPAITNNLQGGWVLIWISDDSGIKRKIISSLSKNNGKNWQDTEVVGTKGHYDYTSIVVH